MAAVDRKIGLNTVVKFTPTAGVQVTLTADFTSFDYNEQIDVVDVTAGNEGYRYEKGTIRSLDFTLRMFAAAQAFEDVIHSGAEGAMVVYLSGVGTGLEVFSMPVIFKGFSKTSPFDGAQEIELTGSRQGPMTLPFGSIQS
jgi:hypothetical protein